MVGFAFWIHNQYENSENKSNNVSDIVSIYDEFSYYMCYCGLLIGPAFTYQTYRDMIHLGE